MPELPEVEIPFCAVAIKPLSVSLSASTIFVPYNLKEKYKISPAAVNDCRADFLTQFVRVQDAKALPPP